MGDVRPRRQPGASVDHGGSRAEVPRRRALRLRMDVHGLRSRHQLRDQPGPVRRGLRAQRPRARRRPVAVRALRRLVPRRRRGQAERQLAERRQLGLFRPRPQGVEDWELERFALGVLGLVPWSPARSASPHSGNRPIEGSRLLPDAALLFVQETRDNGSGE